MSASEPRTDGYIVFAVGRQDDKPNREQIPERVASRFKGRVETVSLLSDDPTYPYRLYRMESA